MEEEGNKLLFSLINKYIPSENNCNILEIGCGSGELLHILSNNYDCNYTGIDPFSIKQNVSNIEFYDYYAEDINSLKNIYNLIFSIRSFHHINNIRKFIDGLHKKLYKTGVFILIDWKKGFDTGITEKYYSLSEVKKLFSESDFIIIESGEKNSVFYIVVRALL